MEKRIQSLAFLWKCLSRFCRFFFIVPLNTALFFAQKAGISWQLPRLWASQNVHPVCLVLNSGDFHIVFQLNEINSPCLFQITYKRTCQFPSLCTCERMRRRYGVTDNVTEIKRKQLAAFQANYLSELCWIMWNFKLSPRCILEYYVYGFWRGVKWLKSSSILKRR
jgi:hypothetical protein